MDDHFMSNNPDFSRLHVDNVLHPTKGFSDGRWRRYVIQDKINIHSKYDYNILFIISRPLTTPVAIS